MLAEVGGQVQQFWGPSSIHHTSELYQLPELSIQKDFVLVGGEKKYYKTKLTSAEELVSYASTLIFLCFVFIQKHKKIKKIINVLYNCIQNHVRFIAKKVVRKYIKWKDFFDRGEIKLSSGNENYFIPESER